MANTKKTYFSKTELYQTLRTAVAANLKRRREALGLSPYQLAEKSGIHASRIYQIERGQGVPTLFVAAVLAESLGMTIPQLIRAPGNGRAKRETA